MLLAEGIGDYPYLAQVLSLLVGKTEATAAEAGPYDGLTVRVSSFSYKKVYRMTLRATVADMCLTAVPWTTPAVMNNTSVSPGLTGK